MILKIEVGALVLGCVQISEIYFRVNNPAGAMK